MKNMAYIRINIISILVCACVCACRYYTQELTFFDVSGYSQNRKFFLISGFSIFFRECAGKPATRETCFPLLESMSWRRISNQMNAFNQSKQSALLSILIYFFDSFPAFFKLINFFIYYLKSGQEIFINKFNKAMKGKMKLESKPHTLTAGRSYRMRHGPDRTDRTGSAAELRGKLRLPVSLMDEFFRAGLNFSEC